MQPDRNRHREPNPTVAEAWRGSAVESRHRGAVAVVDWRGETLLEIGDVDVPIYPRSSLKPLQALALVESGAVGRFGLDSSHVCLACASHNGENEHTTRVAAWLEAIELDPSALECGAHYPYSEDARNALIRGDIQPTVLHNNCSGKHAGFLSVARCMNVDPAGYIAPDHPVQRLVTRIVEEACEYSLEGAVAAVDGCGIPVYGIPLRNLARAFAGFSPRAQGLGARSESGRIIVESILRHPYLIAGARRFCTRVIEASRGRAIMKTGAEGVFTGTLLEEGIGIALKIDDGATRASEVLMAAVLKHFSPDPSFSAALDGECSVPIENAASRTVGRVAAAFV